MCRVSLDRGESDNGQRIGSLQVFHGDQHHKVRYSRDAHVPTTELQWRIIPIYKLFE